MLRFQLVLDFLLDLVRFQLKTFGPIRECCPPGDPGRLFIYLMTSTSANFGKKCVIEKIQISGGSLGIVVLHGSNSKHSYRSASTAPPVIRMACLFS